MAMTISLSDAGKRYNREWIFRRINYSFTSGNAYAITGTNGSGKSTLLQVISGALMPNEGKIEYNLNGKAVAPENMYKHVALCAPYLDLVEEMTLSEFLDFHQQFKPLLKGLGSKDVIGLLGLEAATDRQIRFFSSGMKQRVKLAQCLLSDSEIILLDEPCTNLDEAGIALYHQLVKNYTSEKIVVVSSNDKTEYLFYGKHFEARRV
ncbi:MAG: ATP-binding cassette domain-containing protein [Chitinophagaceae bacterium]|nr:ATP-binding cassette domain-containing protein [Chitinophagaceae bacterium]